MTEEPISATDGPGVWLGRAAHQAPEVDGTTTVTDVRRSTPCAGSAGPRPRRRHRRHRPVRPRVEVTRAAAAGRSVTGHDRRRPRRPGSHAAVVGARWQPAERADRAPADPGPGLRGAAVRRTAGWTTPALLGRPLRLRARHHHRPLRRRHRPPHAVRSPTSASSPTRSPTRRSPAPRWSGCRCSGDLPWWVTIVILVREIGVTLLRFAVIRHGVIAASRGGKVEDRRAGAGHRPLHPAADRLDGLRPLVGHGGGARLTVVTGSTTSTGRSPCGRPARGR